MDFSTVGGVVAITVICYLVGMGCKASVKIKNEWIPVIMGITGGILGAVGINVMPDYPAVDYITAIAVGIVSGLAATGANQVVKQSKK